MKPNDDNGHRAAEERPFRVFVISGSLWTAAHTGVGLPYADNQAEDMIRESEIMDAFDAWVDRFMAHVRAKGRVPPGKFPSVRAGIKILSTFAREAVRRRQPASRNERLILFTRHPEAGRCKTRLIPELGPQGAADVHEELTRGTLAEMDRLRLRRAGVATEVQFEGGTEDEMRSRFGSRSFKAQQPEEGDLGARLSRAFDDAFQAGADRVVVIGSDCPSLSARIMTDGFDALRQCDLVLGPATDGGYYLIGLRRPAPALFRDVDWGTDRVLDQTLNAAAKRGLTAHHLPVLDDVDTPEDLRRWRSNAAGQGTWTPLISVVIPALNEEAHIGAALEHFADVKWLETIVVDGGSADATTGVARSLGARVISSPAGRARQMNAGAAAARGDILLFLHADTVLPESFADAVLSLCADHTVSAGAFSLRIDARGVIYRLIERGVALRCRLLQLPYGDQAIFMRRPVFEAMEGFRELPVMEDFELVRRLKGLPGGGRVQVLDEHVLTSPRRWRRQGPIRTVLINQLAITAFLLGFPKNAIARLLRGRAHHVSDEPSHRYENLEGTKHVSIGQ